jgi:hypothetical protein
MQSNILRNEVAVIKQLKSQPFITLLLPFDPKMTPKYILEGRLKATLEKIKHELYEYYSFVSSKEVFDKLTILISKLDYNTHKKSIVVLLSSEEQKVFYLDVNLEEKYFVADSFQIRQLVHHKKDDKEYLLVVLNSNFAAIYRGLGETISKILLKISDNKQKEEQLRKSYNHYDNCIEKDTLLQRFLRSTDNSLSIILNAFSLPVFVLGPESILAYFKQITHNTNVITGFIKGECDNNAEDEIERTIQPYLSNWQHIKETYLKQQLEGALEEGKLKVGIEGVWNLAKRRNVKLLVVEEGYEYQAYLGKGLIVCPEEATNNAYIKDAVEDAIEKVLADGGEVDFVSNGALNSFMHIAAIRNY